MAGPLDWLMQALGGGAAGAAPSAGDQDALSALRREIDPWTGAPAGAAPTARGGETQDPLANTRGLGDLSRLTGLRPWYEQSPMDIAMGFAPNAMAGMGAGAIRAYHGSPHNFDRFDMSKIGTGEGAQAYGRGLYFAGNEPTAAFYRAKLSPSGVNIIGPDGSPMVTGGALRDATAANAISAQLRDAGIGGEPYMRNSIAQSWLGNPGSQLDAEAVFKRAFGNERIMGMPEQTVNEARNIIKQMVEEAQPILDRYKVERPGRMYEVDIHADPAHLLDWDKPLSQQSANVRDAVNRVGRDPGVGLDRITDDMRGPALLQLLNNPEATAALRQRDVPGIRYLDQGSRQYQVVRPRTIGQDWIVEDARGQIAAKVPSQAEAEAWMAKNQTSNYVMFDDRLIEILRKYGLLPPLAAGAAGGGLLGQEPPT